MASQRILHLDWLRPTAITSRPALMFGEIGKHLSVHRLRVSLTYLIPQAVSRLLHPRVGACLGATVQKQPISLPPTSSTSIPSTDEAHTSEYPVTPWNTSCPDGGLHLIRLRLLPRYCCMLVACALSSTTSSLRRRCLLLLRTEFTILNQLKSSSTYRLFRRRTPLRLCYSSTSARLFRRGTQLRIRIFAISNK